MVNNQYKLYQESILRLAETIVIKFSDCADAVNLGVMQTRGLQSVDINNKSSWKYYQNITGLCHFTDQPMVIASLDVSRQIAFTKENLSINRATKAAYAYGSRYYEELVQRYPEQESLILGILYPCNMQTAINAEDGTILSYPGYLIEANESYLIPKLQVWIKNYLFRWMNRQFIISDDLYFAATLAQLCTHLIQAIVIFRKQACHTEQVHSFHLQQYLASHNYLDRYLPYLNREQALFLYRNINYLQRFAGKKDTFNILVENILTKSGFPLHRFQGIHKLSEMRQEDVGLPANLLAAPKFYRKGINSIAKATTIDTFTLAEVLAKVLPVAIGNDEYQTDNLGQIQMSLERSPSAVVQTKLLESSSIDYSSVVPYTLEDIAMQHWLYHGSKGSYVATTVVSIPYNKEAFRLNPQDTIALFYYCVLQANAATKVNGQEVLSPPLRIPKYRVTRIMRSVLPTLAELRSLCSPLRVSTQTLQGILDLGVPTGTIFSLDAFYEYYSKILKASNLYYRYGSMQEHHFARSEVELVCGRMFFGETVSLSSLQDPAAPGLGKLYSAWTASVGIDFSNFTAADYYELSFKVFKEATGIGIKTPTRLGDIQKALTSLFMELSSYSITLVSKIDAESMIPLGLHGAQLGNIDLTIINSLKILSAPVTVIDIRNQSSTRDQINLDMLIQDVETSAAAHCAHDVGIDVVFLNGQGFTKRVDIRLDYASDAPRANSFNTLPFNQKADLIDAYGYDAEMHYLAEQFFIGGFMAAPQDKSLVVWRTMDGVVNVAGFTLSNKIKELSTRQVNPGKKELTAFTLLVKGKDLSGFGVTKSNKQLTIFKLSPAGITIAPFLLTTKTKTNPSLTVVGKSKELTLRYGLLGKTLSPISFSKPFKILAGFAIGGGNQDPVII